MGAQDPSEAEWLHRMDTCLPTILRSQFWGQQIGPVGRKVAEAKQKRPTVQLAATLLSGAPPPEARKGDKVGPTSTAHSSPGENQAEAGIWVQKVCPTVSQFSFLT